MPTESQFLEKGYKLWNVYKAESAAKREKSKLEDRGEKILIDNSLAGYYAIYIKYK